MTDLIYGRIPLSAEIQAFAYRNVLRIIKETGCGYDEAWDIFKKEFSEKMDAQMDRMKGAEKKHQQNQYKPKMDRNRNRNQRVREDHPAQREVCANDAPAE